VVLLVYAVRPDDRGATVVDDRTDGSVGWIGVDRCRSQAVHGPMPPEVACLFTLLMREMDRPREHGEQPAAADDVAGTERMSPLAPSD
jgi:hypothetical protein